MIYSTRKWTILAGSGSVIAQDPFRHGLLLKLLTFRKCIIQGFEKKIYHGSVYFHQTGGKIIAGMVFSRNCFHLLYKKMQWSRRHGPSNNCAIFTLPIYHASFVTLQSCNLPVSSLVSWKMECYHLGLLIIHISIW